MINARRFLIHLKVLLYKNFLLLTRNWKSTSVQLLSPVVFILAILALEKGIRSIDEVEPEYRKIENIPICKSSTEVSEATCFSAIYAIPNYSLPTDINIQSVMEDFAEQSGLKAGTLSDGLDIALIPGGAGGLLNWLVDNPNSTQLSILFYPNRDMAGIQTFTSRISDLYPIDDQSFLPEEPEGQTDPCSDRDYCNSGGSCTVGRCECFPHYSGQFCDQCSSQYIGYPDCLTPVTCDLECGEGLCIHPGDVVAEKRCDCRTEEFYGDNCELSCSNSNESNVACMSYFTNCSDLGFPLFNPTSNTPYCTCNSGLLSEDNKTCSEIPCNLDCADAGSCYVANKEPKCNCFEDYQVTSDEKSCVLIPCKSGCFNSTENGICENGQCVCNEGFSPPFCEFSCPNDCSNQGLCTEYGCQCFEGFTGDSCSLTGEFRSIADRCIAGSEGPNGECDIEGVEYKILLNRSFTEEETDRFTISSQYFLNRAIINYYSNLTTGTKRQDNSPLWEIMIRNFPIITSASFDVITTNGIIFFYCAIMFNITMLIYSVVNEKEIKIRQGMKMVGVSDAVFWFSWSITNVILVLIVTLLIIFSGMACGFAFFTQTNFMVLFWTFFLFGVTMTPLAFALSMLVNSTKGAISLGMIIFIVGFIVQTVLTAPGLFSVIYEQPNYPWIAGILQFYPPFNFAKGLTDIGYRSNQTYADFTGDPSLQVGFNYDNLGDQRTIIYESYRFELWFDVNNGDYSGSLSPTTLTSGFVNWLDIDTSPNATIKQPVSITRGSNDDKNLNFEIYINVESVPDIKTGDALWLAFGPKLKAAMAADKIPIDLESSSDPPNIRNYELIYYGAGDSHIRQIYAFLVWLVVAWYFFYVFDQGLPPWFFGTKRFWGFVSERNTTSESVELQEFSPEKTGAEQDVIDEKNEVFDGDDKGIKIMGLGKIFGGLFSKKFHALKSLSLSMKQGQVVAVLGHNGAGKTTTINILTGVFPASYGDAYIFGKSTNTEVSEIQKHLGVCPQHDILWRELTAKEHIQIFGGLKLLSSSQIKEEIETRLTEVLLYEVRNKQSGTFSGGMKRRLSVAMASVGNPQVILLDEPTTGLDPVSKREIWKSIQKLKEDKVVLLTTHSMEEADVLGDKIAIMAHGELKCVGTSLHLKDKYGDGYRINAHAREGADGEDRTPELEKLIEKYIPEATQIADTGGFLIYGLETQYIDSLVPFFKYVEKKKKKDENFVVSDLSVSQTSLEEVFLKITSEDKPKVKKPTKTKTTKNGSSSSSS